METGAVEEAQQTVHIAGQSGNPEQALEAVREIRENQGRLGVFWHTQGSGKSISMIFFSQKVLRKVPGNWTFVVVTDRETRSELASITDFGTACRAAKKNRKL